MSEDSWGALYAAAARVAEIEPWKWMGEDEILAFEELLVRSTWCRCGPRSGRRGRA